MKKISLNEELLHQIKLMNFDRTMTLLEQDPKGKTKKQIEKVTQKTDRLGSEFRATPKIFSDPVYIEYQKLSPEEKVKRENEFLNKKWKSKLCSTNLKQKNVYNGEYFVTHEEFCKPFGGTQVYRSKSEGKSFLDVSEKDILGKGFYCGCKMNGQTFIGDKTVRVNDYLDTPITEITHPVAEFLSDKHNIVMIATIAFAMFGGGPGSVASLIFDFIEVGMYIEEGDPFMAGLALCFAIIPFGDLMKLWFKTVPGVKNFTKKTLLKILKKLKLKKPLTPDEKKFVDAINDAQLKNKAFWRLMRIKLKSVIYKHDVFYFVRLIVFLVEKGLLLSRFLIKWGLMIGGVFYSWYKIAEILGIKPKSEKTEKDLTKEDTVELKVLNYLNIVSSKGYNYSTELKNISLSEVAAIQYALYSGGYFGKGNKKTYSVSNIEWGYYDTYTKDAVENYQEKNGLKVDGIAGPNTIKKIITDIQKNKITDLKKTDKIAHYDFSKTPTKEKSLEIDKEKIVMAYDKQKALDSLEDAYDKKYMNINSDSLEKVFSYGFDIDTLR